MVGTDTASAAIRGLVVFDDPRKPSDRFRRGRGNRSNGKPARRGGGN